MPVYFLRFEDLICNREDTIKEVFKFTLGVKSIEGTFIEKRISDVVGGKEKVTQLYKPRSGQINSNLRYFNEA